MWIAKEILEFITGLDILSMPCRIELVIVENEYATTVTTANLINPTHISNISLPGNKSMQIGSANADIPTPQGIAIIIDNLTEDSILLISSPLFPVVRERIRLGMIALDNADATAIGAVVKSWYLPLYIP